jgi:hypothetical protein
MRSKKELAEIYFSHRTLEWEIVQDKENGMTECELGKKYNQPGWGHSGIKRLRQKLMTLFNAKGWDDICLQLVAMEIIMPRVKNGFVFDQKPTQALIDAVEEAEIEEQEEKRIQADKEWNERNKRK